MPCAVGLEEVDEAREAMRKFEQRRQLDSESVVEFEQALRSLYRVAWPKATPEQKEVALKTRFEEGLASHDMQHFFAASRPGRQFRQHRAKGPEICSHY